MCSDEELRALFFKVITEMCVLGGYCVVGFGLVCVLSGVLWLHISFHGLSAMIIPIICLKYHFLYSL